jgi:putative ABC transport system permease protein
VDNLIVANITQRPTRTITSVLGIALGVVLIVVTVGLARGILYDTGRRQSRVGAEIMFQPPGSFSPGVTTTPLTLPVAYCQRLQEIEGVHAVTPVGRYIRSGAAGIGFEIIEGIAAEDTASYASYARVSGIRIAKGHNLSRDDEIIIDRPHAERGNLRPGSTVTLFNRTFRVAGIYEPESSARIKMRLSVMQQLLGAPNKCSAILVQCANPGIEEAVARRIDERFPGNQILFTRDIPRFYDQGFPALNTFLRVVMGLATIISILVTLLAMYTAVVERTREIGILKSLGASKSFIVQVIEKEALLIGLLGVLTGYVFAFLTKLGITKYTSLLVRFEFKWMLMAAMIGLMGGVLGALYPAVRAANQDPVKALAYE